MAGEALTLWAPTGVELDELDAVLFGVFDQAREALLAARPVLVLVCEEDVLGHGEPAGAAVAHAVVGLVRALALEGARQGWRINALSVPADDYDVNWMRWAAHLCEPDGPSGVLLRLGREHLGRLPV